MVSRRIILLGGLFSAAAILRRSSRQSYAPNVSLLPKNRSFTGRQHLLINADSGQIISEHRSNLARPPASLTKLMTLACVFQAMQEPVSYNLNSNIKIPNNIKRFESDLIGFDGKDSKGNPVRNGHTGKGLLPGEEYKMRDLLIGVGAKSDVRSTYAIALSVAKVYGWEGSEDQILARFVQLMNQTALNIGMHNTYFSNPAGESVNGNQSTAHDIARLVSYIQIEFPELIEHACGTPYPNLGILSDSRRHSSRALRARHDQIQWAKTGYTGVSGFSETAHIKIGEQSFIAVLFGAKSSTDRKNQMLGLVDKAVEYASKTSPTISTRNAPTPSAAPKTSPRPQLRPSR